VCVCVTASAQHDQDINSSTFFGGNFTPTKNFHGATFGLSGGHLFLGGSNGEKGITWNAMEDGSGTYKFLTTRSAFKMDYSNWNNYAVWRFSQNTPSAGNAVTWQTAMQLQKTSSGIDLRLCGNFYAQEININAGVSWCDYVFAKDYRLRSLENLQLYIDTYKHLPDVPSEQEVKENGIAVTEMLQIQMKKIEELTLYTLQQQKEIDELRALLLDKE